MLGDLSRKYESGDRGPGTVAHTEGDAGGASYGTYQLSSAAGTLQEFLGWMLDRPRFAEFAQRLIGLDVGSEAFDGAWRQCAADFPDRFGEAQHDYIEDNFYWPAVRSLQQLGFNPLERSEAIRQIVWSAAVQYGPGYVAELFQSAGDGEPAAMDEVALIRNIYDVRASDEWTAGSPSLRPGLRARFEQECNDALGMI